MSFLTYLMIQSFRPFFFVFKAFLLDFFQVSSKTKPINAILVSSLVFTMHVLQLPISSCLRHAEMESMLYFCFLIFWFLICLVMDFVLHDDGLRSSLSVSIFWNLPISPSKLLFSTSSSSLTLWTSFPTFHFYTINTIRTECK